MSEFDGQLPAGLALAQGESAHDVPGATAGTLLRQAREAAGLHIAALAVALKVPVKKLEALEADRLDLLPDAVFVRALASSVCRTLKIDVAQVLALLPQTGKPHLGFQRASINTPFRAPGDGPGPSLWAQVSRPAVLAGLLLVLGTLVLILLPNMQQQDMGAEPVAAAPPIVSPTVLPAPEPTAVTESPAGMAPAMAVTPAPAAVVAVVPGPDVPVALASVAPAPALAASAPSAAAMAAGVIVFTAKGESWVEVTDAKGVVVLRRTLAAGESAGASGTLPLAAVVGRVDATLVQVRGKAFDLSAVSRDNVARFEVK